MQKVISSPQRREIHQKRKQKMTKKASLFVDKSN
jgi:hypothetical protein